MPVHPRTAPKGSQKDVLLLLLVVCVCVRVLLLFCFLFSGGGVLLFVGGGGSLETNPKLLHGNLSCLVVGALAIFI